MADDLSDPALELAFQIRRAGACAEFSYKSASLKKQLKQAQTLDARLTVIIGADFSDNRLIVKNMAPGDQQSMPVEEFMKALPEQRQGA